MEQQYDYYCVRKKLRCKQNGETPIELINGRRISAYHISVSDWNLLQEATGNVNSESDPEIGRFTVEHLTSNDLSRWTLPECDAGPYISTQNTYKGNCYNSNTDTYATVMGNPAYNVYFLYIIELECFAVVTQSYYVY